MAYRKKYTMITAVIMALVTMTACQYKELDDYQYDNGLTIHIDNSRVGSSPEEYRVAFYDRQGSSNPILYDIANHDRVTLPIGRYDMTLWNKDTPHVLTKGYNNRETAFATTQLYSTTEAYYNPYLLVDSLFNQEVMDYPDYMIHGSLNNISVENGSDESVTVRTDSMMVALDITIQGIKGLSIVKRCKGALNNVAGARTLYDRSQVTRATASQGNTQDSVTVVFNCDVNMNDSTVQARFNVFNLFPGDSPETLQHRIALMFWTDYGNVYFVEDITDEIARAAKYDGSVMKVNIVLPPFNVDLREILDMEKSGFSTDVTGWGEGHSEDIKL